MNPQLSGWLPYGSSDSSVILQLPLTSAPAGWTVVGSPVHDSVKGLNPNGNGGYSKTSLTGYAALDYGGQISVEVEKAWACYNDPTNGSSGYTPAAQEYLLSVLAGTGGAQSIIDKTVGGALLGFMNGASQNKSFTDWKYDGGTTYNVLVHSGPKSDFVRINIGWWGGKAGGLFVMAIDGHIYAAGLRAAGTNANVFQNIYLGSDRGIGGFMNGYYFRNLQISTRPPAMAVHPKLRRVSVLSDSLFNTDSLASVYRDEMASHTFRRYLENLGYRPGDMTVDVNSGYHVHDASVGNIFSSRVATLLANNPQVVLFRGGTNDVILGYTINAAWYAELQSLMTSILAGTSVERIVVGKVPSTIASSASGTYTAATRAAVSAINAYYDQLPAWNSKIVVADVYSALGGESPARGTFIGQVDGANDNLHCAAVGHKLMGECYAKAAVANLWQ